MITAKLGLFFRIKSFKSAEAFIALSSLFELTNNSFNK